MNQALAKHERRTTQADASRQLGVDPRAVRRMINAGDLKTVPVPAGVRATVLQSSIDEMLARMQAASKQA